MKVSNFPLVSVVTPHLPLEAVLLSGSPPDFRASAPLKGKAGELRWCTLMAEVTIIEPGGFL